MRRGIGIGLAVCRAIAEVHGGHLRITDTQGGGTTVCLTLALSEQPEQPRELTQ
jgi:two-component system sensor histidine kinase KdpD